MTPACDFVGNPITIGCRCAYPMRRGSKMWLATIRVDCIERIGEAIVLTGDDSTGRRRHTRNIQNCIVVESRP
jgi:hypothetical protein